MPLPVARRPVVVITGASSGIGRACAFAFAKRGYDLVLAARRLDRLSELAGQLHPLGAHAVPVQCDVTRPEEVARLREEVDEHFGYVNVLVNNAGVGLYGSLEATSDEQLRQVFDVNVFGLQRVTRELLTLLRRQRDSQIINVSSVLGHRALPYRGGYAASKAAVNALTECLRLELKPQGVDVILVSPGFTATDFQSSRVNAEGFKAINPPLKAMSAEDVAQAIVHASRKGRRDTVLTLPGRVMAYGNRVSPRLVDLVAGRLIEQQRSETSGS
jgi:short-subunit dehydrogenase